MIFYQVVYWYTFVPTQRTCDNDSSWTLPENRRHNHRVALLRPCVQALGGCFSFIRSATPPIRDAAAVDSAAAGVTI